MANKSPSSALFHVTLFGIQGQVAGPNKWNPRSLGLGSKLPVSNPLPQNLFIKAFIYSQHLPEGDVKFPTREFWEHNQMIAI
jgi:hypothetical protein